MPMAMSRELPGRIFLAGVVCFVGGYAAMRYTRLTPHQIEQEQKLFELIRFMEESGHKEKADEIRELSIRDVAPRPYAVAGKAAFWAGLALILIGAGAWLTQPAAKRSRERAEPEDEPDDDDIELVPCPYCGKSIYEESERCPECGNYISREDDAL